MWQIKYIHLCILFFIFKLLIKPTKKTRNQICEKFEATKRVIKSRKSKDIQCNVQQKKDKRTNNDI